MSDLRRQVDEAYREMVSYLCTERPTTDLIAKHEEAKRRWEDLDRQWREQAMPDEYTTVSIVASSEKGREGR